MSDLNTTVASTGAALVSVATIALGSILGEYVVILALGLMGTLLALAEEEIPFGIGSFVFVFKGLVLSFVFTGIITSLAIKYLPSDSGLTPYAILGAVAFMIGWTSNKWTKVKDWFLDLITSYRKQ